MLRAYLERDNSIIKIMPIADRQTGIKLLIDLLREQEDIDVNVIESEDGTQLLNLSDTDLTVARLTTQGDLEIVSMDDKHEFNSNNNINTMALYFYKQFGKFKITSEQIVELLQPIVLKAIADEALLPYIRSVQDAVQTVYGSEGKDILRKALTTITLNIIRDSIGNRHSDIIVPIQHLTLTRIIQAAITNGYVEESLIRKRIYALPFATLPIVTILREALSEVNTVALTIEGASKLTYREVINLTNTLMSMSGREHCADARKLIATVSSVEEKQEVLHVLQIVLQAHLQVDGFITKETRSEHALFINNVLTEKHTLTISDLSMFPEEQGLYNLARLIMRNIKEF